MDIGPSSEEREKQKVILRETIDSLETPLDDPAATTEILQKLTIETQLHTKLYTSSLVKYATQMSECVGNVPFNDSGGNEITQERIDDFGDRLGVIRKVYHNLKQNGNNKTINLAKAAIKSAFYTYAQLRTLRSTIDKRNNKEQLPSLYDCDLPYHIVSILLDKVDAKIDSLEKITTDSMAGMNGGGVTRAVLDGKNYVIKVETNQTAAQKSVSIPELIFEAAKEDLLAQRLARRIPESFLSEVVEHNGYYVTISEDVKHKRPELDLVDRRIMGNACSNGMNNEVVEQLYTLALYHEVMGNLEVPETIEIPTFDTNIPTRKVLTRFGTDAALAQPFLAKLGKTEQEWREELREYEREATTIGVYDARDENFVNGYLVDFGMSKRGNEIDDIARPLINHPEICGNKELMKQYVNAYVQMRQDIQAISKGTINYTPNKEKLHDLVEKQATLDAWKLSGWMIHTDRPDEFKPHYDSARALLN